MYKALRSVTLLVVLAALALTGCGGDSPPAITTPAAVATPDCNGQFFEATRRTVCQPFLSHWQQNGGLALYGYPISDLLQETSTSGEVYTAQYFERARFELHKESNQKVMLGRVGALMQKPQPRATRLPDAHYFAETGHNLKRAFLKFWLQNGSVAQFGYPITEEQIEKNAFDGKDYIVQYFERARFELHPEKLGTSYEVQLSQLGTELYNSIYSKQPPPPDPASATK